MRPTPSGNRIRARTGPLPPSSNATYSKKWLSWEEAFHKIAYLPARFFNLEGRGVIEPGAFADLVALDPAAVKANATYLDPKRLSGGLVHLWVNGRQMIENGRLLSGEPGRVLTHTYERQS